MPRIAIPKVVYKICRDFNITLQDVIAAIDINAKNNIDDRDKVSWVRQEYNISTWQALEVSTWAESELAHSKKKRKVTQILPRPKAPHNPGTFEVELTLAQIVTATHQFGYADFILACAEDAAGLGENTPEDTALINALYEAAAKIKKLEDAWSKI